MIAKVAAAAVFACIVAAGLVYVRLMHGPISLDFLARHVREGHRRGTGRALSVRIETVALRLNDVGLLQFELGNVRVTDAKGEPLTMAPSALVSLSRRALLVGRLAVETIDLVSARLTLFYSDDGTLSLKFSPSAHQLTSGSPALRGSVDTAQPAAPRHPDGGDWTLGRIDLVKVLSEASAPCAAA